jgi:hypothetical protein
VTTLFSITPSNTSWGDKVDEDRLNHNIDSEGEKTHRPWTSSKWVTGSSSIATVSEQPSRKRVGATTSVHQRLMRRSSREPQRLEPHIDFEKGRSGYGSTSSGGDLARGQVHDSW